MERGKLKQHHPLNQGTPALENGGEVIYYCPLAGKLTRLQKMFYKVVMGQGKLIFFQGQGKVREFCNYWKSQGKVREFCRTILVAHHT